MAWPRSVPDFQTQESKCHEVEIANLDLTGLDTESGA